MSKQFEIELAKATSETIIAYKDQFTNGEQAVVEFADWIFLFDVIHRLASENLLLRGKRQVLAKGLVAIADIVGKELCPADFDTYLPARQGCIVYFDLDYSESEHRICRSQKASICWKNYAISAGSLPILKDGELKLPGKA